MDLTSWIGMVRRDAGAEIDAVDLREVLLNLMKTVPQGSAEHANLNSLQQHFNHAGQSALATCRLDTRPAAGNDSSDPLQPS